MIKIFLVDDHELVRRGIADLLEREPDMTVVGESGTAHQVGGRVAATDPDVLILDVRLPDGSGIDVCRSISSERPGITCLILTGHDDDEAFAAAVLAGAAGYVLKDIRGQILVESIRRVAAGERLISKADRDRVTASLAGRRRDERSDDHLTGRERQVLELIAEGLSNRQIGERLGLAEKTVKNYVSRLLDKLGMDRRTQAAVYGARIHG